MPGFEELTDLSALERCFGCRNRTSLHDAIVLECGLLCCRRCAQRREVLPVKNGARFVIEVIG